MPMLRYQQNELFLEDVRLADLANLYGTPCYVYSQALIEQNWQLFDTAFNKHSHLVCYAVKANSNLSILNILAKKHSGFDIVSLGELERVLTAGGDPKRIIFSGVGKQPYEILRAIEVGIKCFNVESEAELILLNQLAKQKNTVAHFALRVNPNINAGTHPHIATGLHHNKFGIPLEQISSFIQTIKTLSHVKLIGVASHIGSQLMDLTPLTETVVCLTQLADHLSKLGFQLTHINVGGGLGIGYQEGEHPPTVKDYANALLNKLANYSTYEIILEPGRAIVANAGFLLSKIVYLKPTPHKNFAIVDAAMSELIRPALYDAWHDILPVIIQNGSPRALYDVVGPICESADFIGKDRELAIKPLDLLAICHAGAYGASMSSHYNSRPNVAEVLVHGNQTKLIRRRETIQDLFALEKITD